MIDPATTSSSTRETLEFRFRALSKFDHRGAGSRGVVFGELPLPSAGANGSQGQSADASTLPQNANSNFPHRARGHRAYRVLVKAGSSNRASAPASCGTWHSARPRFLRVKSHSSDRSTNTPDLSAGTPPVEIQSPFRVYSKCPTKIANDSAKIHAL